MMSTSAATTSGLPILETPNTWTLNPTTLSVPGELDGAVVGDAEGEIDGDVVANRL